MTTTLVWLPYCGAAPTPLELATRWNGDPLLWTGLLLLTVALWRTAKTPGRQATIMLGIGALAIGFASPLCALSSALFSARTVHHILLIAVAAPLIAGRGTAGESRHLWLATGAHAAVLWTWHAPLAYSAALSNTGVYWFMQLSLLGSAIVFWRSVRASTPWPAAAALVATLTQMTLLGALITLAPRALYAPHLMTTQAWGLSPLADQQLAGVIMWIPAGTIYLATALSAARRALATSQELVDRLQPAR